MSKHLNENLLNYLFRNLTSEFPHSFSSFLCKNESTSLFGNVGYLRYTPSIQSIKIAITCIMSELSRLGGRAECWNTGQ